MGGARPVAALTWSDVGELHLTLADAPGMAADFITADVTGTARVGASAAQLLELLDHIDGARVRLGVIDERGPILVSDPLNAATIMLQMPCALRATAAAA